MHASARVFVCVRASVLWMLYGLALDFMGKACRSPSKSGQYRDAIKENLSVHLPKIMERCGAVEGGQGPKCRVLGGEVRYKILGWNK